MGQDGFTKLPRPCPCGVNVARLRVREGRVCRDCKAERDALKRAEKCPLLPHEPYPVE